MSFCDQFSLKGKNVLLTGATGHLGQPLALGLAEAGANVLVNSKSKKNCVSLVNKIKSKNLKAELANFDITDLKAISKYVKYISKIPIDCLINNAYAGIGGTIQSSNPESYLTSYNISIVSVHNLTTKLLNNFRLAVNKSGDACIINIASMYGIVSPDLRLYESPEGSNPPFYGAAKAALLQWTKYAACEFGSENIRVNAISPGAFPSTFVQKNSPELIKKLNNKIPLGRIGKPTEITGIVVMLASRAGSYITGTNITLDGGFTCW